MASNSSAAAAMAALFGIRDVDHHEDQIKPLLAPHQHHHQHHLQPPVAPPSNAASAISGAGSAAAAGQPAAAPPPVKKKRTLPDPDAEVIALTPKTLMATNRFVCEVCNKGFQREQNLQLHRRGHNLPWKLKQKNPLQAQRRRVYLCPEPTCVHHDPSRALGDLTGIKKHFCRKHGEKKWKCDKCSKRYAVQSDWKAHSKICGTREYRCDCGTLFSRRDSFITHRAFCDALAQESARLPPAGAHHYGSTSAANMALSLSQVGSHLASTLQDAHGHHHHASPELLRFGGSGSGGCGGTMAARLDHLLSSSSASAFRPLPPPQSSASAPFLLGPAQPFGDGDGSGPHAFLQGKPFHGLMQLPDLQGNGAGGPSPAAPGLYNFGYIANSANSSGTSSHGHVSQGHMTTNTNQFSEGGAGAGGSETSATALFSAGGNYSGGDHHQVAHGGRYTNDQAMMLPQMSATALLQKAAQMGSSASASASANRDGASVFGGFAGSTSPSIPHGRSPMVDQGQMHLQSLMNSLAGGGNAEHGMFGNGSMFDPRLYDMEHEVKFSPVGGGGGDVTRDFLGVGVGSFMRGMPIARVEHRSGGGSDMGSLEAEMKSVPSSFRRMQ